MLGEKTVFFFGSKFSEKISDQAIPVLMSLIFIHKEIVEVVAEYSVGFITSGLFFPLYAGVATSIYEIFRDEFPGVFARNKMLAEPLPKEPNTLEDVLKSCHEEAELRFSKLEKKFVASDGTGKNREEVTQDLILKSPSKSKKLLECRRAFFDICKSESSFFSKYAQFTREALVNFNYYILL